MRWQGPHALAVVRPIRVYLLDFYCSGIQFVLCIVGPYLCFISFLYLDLYVFGDGELEINQVSHLTQDSIWEIDKNTRKTSPTRESRG